jgi:hypothetical protein
MGTPPSAPVPPVAAAPGPPRAVRARPWLLGCGAALLVSVALLVLLGLVALRTVKRRFEAVTAELRALGFETTARGQVVRVREPVAGPCLFVGQVVRLEADCATNVAIVAQQATVAGRVAGKVYFRGQLLEVAPGAHVAGGLDVRAQLVRVLGRVDGPVEGTWRDFEPAPPATNAGPTARL